MDFAIEHAGDFAEEDEPTVDYSSYKEAAAQIDPSEIEIIGGESKEVILLDDATEVNDGSISAEVIEVVIDADAIEETPHAAKLFTLDDASDDDGADALQDND